VFRIQMQIGLDATMIRNKPLMGEMPQRYGNLTFLKVREAGCCCFIH